ncbi:Cytochrome c-type biogenesis protein CcmH [Commensalibacter sp. Nvir]|uniref:cytochrome c-type biogenesis protein n=1 Tax=Commensalibacter sp. Nvir TaxID=3069817 RepID=UPI002D44E4A0|nr:Cytochrome c-type biogenesis protein CcmH [Commensalibacter sp. Nvir]
MRTLYFFSCLCFLFFSFKTYAVDSPEEMLANPQLEKRAETIGSQLRCLVCQNETIEESSAPLAKDLRQKVREKLVAGDSDEKIMQWMVKRYGNFVRLNPPFNLYTSLLWFIPILSFFGGIILAFGHIRKKTNCTENLSAEEKKHITELLHEPRP